MKSQNLLFILWIYLFYNCIFSSSILKSMYVIIINAKLGKPCLLKYTVNILFFSLIIVLMAYVFAFLVWFRKHSGHIMCCYFLKKCGNQVGRLVRDLCAFLCCCFTLPLSIFLFSLFFFLFPAWLLFFFNVASTTGSSSS